jgi:hypothetical protein
VVNLSKITNLVLIAAAISAVPALSTVARADPSGPVAVSVGVSELTGSAGDFTDRDGFRAAADLNLPVSPVFSGGTPSVDLDYDTHSGKGANIDTLGLFLADRYHFSIHGIGPYLGAGVGGAYVHSSKDGNTDTRTDVAGKLIAGWNFGQTFVEGSYALNVNVFGGNTNTLDLSVGTRF